MHDYATNNWLQRDGSVEEVEYKGKKRQLRVIGSFALSGDGEKSLGEVRVELLSLKNHQTKRHSLVGRIELEQEHNSRKLHKDLNLVEFAVTALERDQGLAETP